MTRHPNTHQHANPWIDLKASNVRRHINKAVKLAEKKEEKAIIRHLVQALDALLELQGLA